MASRTPSGPARDSEAVGRLLGSVTSILFVISLLCSLMLHPSMDAGLVSGYWRAARTFQGLCGHCNTPPPPPDQGSVIYSVSDQEFLEKGGGTL